MSDFEMNNKLGVFLEMLCGRCRVDLILWLKLLAGSLNKALNLFMSLFKGVIQWLKMEIQGSYSFL